MSRKINKTASKDATGAAIILALLDMNINEQYRTSRSPADALAELQAMETEPRLKAAIARTFHEGMNSLLMAVANTARQLLRVHGTADEALLSRDSAEAVAIMQGCAQLLEAEAAQKAEEAAKVEDPANAAHAE